MCADGIILPGHLVTSFFCSSSHHSTIDPSDNVVSVVNLHCDCLASLLCDINSSHPDHDVWLQSYHEEKKSITLMGTFQILTIGKYRALHEKGAIHAIPSMCILTTKKDGRLLTLRAKSCIVVLGNHKDRDRSKSEQFAPVLRSDSLHS